MTPEFSRRIALDTIGSAWREVAIDASPDECGALAKRFDLIALDSLHADAELAARAVGVEARGRVVARAVQRCAVTDDPVACSIDEPFTLRFVAPDQVVGDEEVELGADDCDTVAHDGSAIDLGEAVAQTLGLALPPFPRSQTDDAAERVWRAGPDARPFAGLAGLFDPST